MSAGGDGGAGQEKDRLGLADSVGLVLLSQH